MCVDQVTTDTKTEEAEDLGLQAHLIETIVDQTTADKAEESLTMKKSSKWEKEDASTAWSVATSKSTVPSTEALTEEEETTAATVETTVEVETTKTTETMEGNTPVLALQ